MDVCWLQFGPFALGMSNFWQCALAASGNGISTLLILCNIKKIRSVIMLLFALEYEEFHENWWTIKILGMDYRCRLHGERDDVNHNWRKEI